jgi:transcriptional regulator with XRE-family HTH domain
MNLTQKQLASLANVSTPTISRFEQNAKNIQLSSVLSILDVLGVTDKRTLVFPDEEVKSDGDVVAFWGQDGTKRVLCRISRAAIEDHFSDRDLQKSEIAFKKYRKQIEAIARRKYSLDQLEHDGTVLIRNSDVV